MDLTRTSPYTILTIDEHGWVTGGADTALRDPTPYKAHEAHFEASTEARQNPLRLASGSRITKVVPVDPPVVDPMTGDQITEKTVTVPWTDCIQDADYTVREMTDAEKAERDAYNKAQKDAKEAERIAKLIPTYGEKVAQFVGLLAIFGLTMPIEEDAASLAMYQAVKADVSKTADSQMTMAVYNDLRKDLSNDDIYEIAKAIGVSQ